MKTRQIDLMRPWARWMVRHRIGFVLIALNWTLHPVAFLIHAVVSGWPDVWTALRETNESILQAMAEEKTERDSK